MKSNLFFRSYEDPLHPAHQAPAFPQVPAAAPAALGTRISRHATPEEVREDLLDQYRSGLDAVGEDE